MPLISDLWTKLWETIVDNRNKLTATGGFLLGIICCLGFKDFYPDLERSWQRHLRQRKQVKRLPRHSSSLSTGSGKFVRLEDHSEDEPDDHTHAGGADGNVYEIRDGVDGLIGNTPMIRLGKLSEAVGCEILAKAEFLNGAGGSPKDRVALSIIERAEEEGELVPGRGDVVYEGTVGSTGISLAGVCRARGYKAHICMPSDVSTDKSDLLLKLGAEVERVKPASIIDTNQFVNVARRRAKEHTDDLERPGRGFFADQFENEANYLAHEMSTGPEIYKQCEGRLDAFVAGAGTGGTISGVAIALKPLLPDLRVVLADPQGSSLFNKIKYGVMFSPTEAEGTRRRHQVDSIVEGVGINRLTRNFEKGMHLVDDAVKVTDEEAKGMARWLVENEGLFVGPSSAVNCVAAARLGREMQGKRVVTVICDSGSRYLGRFWKEKGIEGMELEDILEGRIKG